MREKAEMTGERDPMTAKTNVRTMSLVAMMTVIICVCAWITVPLTVPFTMQIVGVFAAVLILGGKRGTLSLLLYMLLGAVGLPVFSGFRGGLATIVGPTGGYMVGFFAISLLYALFEERVRGSVKATVAVLLAGLAVCYLFGTVWFCFVMNGDGGNYTFVSALAVCVVPYILPDLAKLALALFVSDRVNRVLHIR